jgi:hypothetical protein
VNQIVRDFMQRDLPDDALLPARTAVRLRGSKSCTTIAAHDLANGGGVGSGIARGITPRILVPSISNQYDPRI